MTISTITPLPTAPSRDDAPATFISRANAFLAAMVTMGTELNTSIGEMNTDIAGVNSDAAAAATSASEAAASATAAGNAAGASIWVSGQAYAEGDAAISGIDYQTYRAETATSGTTDPSADANWTKISGVLPSETGNAGKFLTTDGSTASWAAVSAGKVSRTASGAITAGDPVSINQDGTVTPVSVTNQTESTGTIAYWETADNLGIWHSSAYDTAANKGLLLFNNTTATDLEAVVVTNTSGTLTYGAPVQVTTNNVNYTGVCYNAAQDVFVAVWRDGTAGLTQAIAGEVAGTTISWGSPVTLTSGNPGPAISIISIDSTSNVLVAYDNGSSNSEVRTLSLSGTTITANTAVTMERSERGLNSLAYNSDDDYFVWAYTDAGEDPRIVKITVSGTTPSIGTPADIDGSNNSGQPNVRYDPASGNFLYAYSKQVSGTWTPHFVILSESGGSFSKTGSTQTVSTNLYDQAADIHIERDTSNNTFAVITWSESASDSFGYSISLVGGEIVINTNQQSFDISGRDENRISAYYDPDNSEYVVLFIESSTNDGAGQVYSPAISTTNKKTYFGIADSTISDGASGDITIVSGLNANVSGLTAGDFYYLADDGSLTTTSNGYPVGHALSATSIILDNVGYNAIPEQTNQSGNFLKTDGSNSSWSSVQLVGAASDGSIVASSGQTTPQKAAVVVDYDRMVSTDNEAFFSATNSVNQPPPNATARAMGILTPVYSSYWKKWFALTRDLSGNTTIGNARIAYSNDGVNWCDFGEVKNCTANNALDNFSSDAIQRAHICFDESNGRMWVALFESSGSYRLALGYIDFLTDDDGVGIVYGSTSGSEQSRVNDWFWVPNLNKIVILWHNTSNSVRIATIDADSTSISNDNNVTVSSGGSEARFQLYYTQTDASTYKWYLAYDDTGDAWYAETTNAAPTSFTNFNPGSPDYNESSYGDMSPTTLVLPRSSLYYKDVPSNAWRDGTSWTSVSLPAGTGGDCYNVKYDPVKDDWIGFTTTGHIIYSKDGRSWENKGRCSTWGGDAKAYASRKTTGYSY